MAKIKATHSVVEVVVKAQNVKHPHPFPLDMARYDSCVPATEQDAHIIENTIAHETETLFSAGWSGIVVLRRFYMTDNGNARSNINMERWRSFGWDVVKVYLPGESAADTMRYTK